MHAVDRATFEAMVVDAVAELPDQFRERIENVSFIVENSASPADLRLTGTRRGGTLLGLYRGVPLPRRGSSYGYVTPDVIVLFQQPQQRMARDAAQLKALVGHTVRHEVAHYFGISDRRLRELGSY
jgi:predicted Zn-dependent protease with MMP-like domain